MARNPQIGTLTRSRKHRYALGLMSGTSADGIDAACIRIEGRGERMRVELVHHTHRAFRRELRERLLAIMAPARTSTEDLARLHTELGEAFGSAARAAISELSPGERPTFIGLAGQTVCHYPRALRGRTYTLQLGSPAHVAAITGLPVVADFRQSDVAAGGQGAPLVPWTDWVLFRNAKVSRAVQNIGGIGNVTWLPAGGQSDDVIAFDTGPGNMIIDGLMSRITNGRCRMDRDGRTAGRGRVIGEVLNYWLKHPFLGKRPPRTTGREEFGESFLHSQLPELKRSSKQEADWVATCTAFTVRAIASSYRRFIPAMQSKSEASSNNSRCELVLTGGGSRNATMRRMLADELPAVRITTIDEYGIPAEAKEAVSFAMLAAARLDGVHSNLPQVTGASRSVSLGAVYA